MEIEDLLIGYSISEKRSALYYTTRYVKQAGSFEKYLKDIFEDGFESKPDEKVKSLTLRIIKLIEDTSKKKASGFKQEEFYFWMDRIAQIEDSLDTEPDEEKVKKALEELSKFSIPKLDNSVSKQ